MSQSRGSTTGLLAKVLLSLALFGCAFPAFKYSYVATLRASQPSEAAKIAPGDARAIASTLGSHFDQNPDFKPTARDLDYIRAALKTQPLEPKLVSLLGLAYQAANDSKSGTRAMELAYRVSRRDVVSGLYLIETAAASGDVQRTLSHYNAVLSTQPGLSAALLPILVSAISYPEIRAGLRSYLVGSAPWAPSFVAAIAEGASVDDLQALLLPLPQKLLGEEYAPSLAKALYRVALEGDKEATGRFARAINPGFSGNELTTLGISTETLDKRLGLLAWTFPNVEGVQVEPIAPNSIQITIEPLAHGKVASRDLLIEGPGTYQFMQHLDFGAGSGNIAARWTGECIMPTKSERFWEQRLPPNKKPGTYRSALNVPAKCQIVRVVLLVEGTDGQFPSTLIIKGLSLSPSIS